MNIVVFGQIFWAILVIAWFVVRYPFARRVKRMRVVDNRMDFSERVRLTISTFGMGVLPLIYISTDLLDPANRETSALVLTLGMLTGAASIVLFRVIHKELGRMWSVSLQLKEGHKLVTEGVYRYVRHPMYSAFWLMAIAQSLLLANWIAGLSGLVGFGTLFVLRIKEEERMLEETFGDEYRNYRKRSKLLIPFVF